MPQTALDGIVIGDPPSIRIDGPTLQPGHSALVGNGMSEADKYKKMWEHAEYRAMAPGEDAAHIFLAKARPPQGAEVIDFGAGTGRGALNLAVFGAMKVRMLDFAENCLDDDIRQMLVTQAHVMCFARQDLNDPIPWTAEYGFCTDVMEHIPPRDVDRVLTNVLKAAQHVFFQISTVDDVCGALIGQPLHLSVHPYAWWLAKLQTEFECQVHWSQEFENGCMFYVTAWWTGKKITENGVLNCEEQEALDNVKANTALEYHQVQPTWDLNGTECLVLGGGPSLDSQLDTIREMVAEGCKVVTLNGAYNWALRNDIQVGAHIMVDAREFNARFVQPVQEKCQYFIASQCHPSAYAYLEKALDPGDDDDGGEDEDIIATADGDLFAPLSELTAAQNVELNFWAKTLGMSPERPMAVIYNHTAKKWVAVAEGVTISELPMGLGRKIPARIWQWHTTASFIAPVLVERFPKGYYAISGGSTVLLRALPLMRTMGFKMFHLFGCDSCLSESGAHHAYEQAENEGNMAVPVIVGGKTFTCHPWMASQASEFMDLVKYLGNEMYIEVHGGGLLAWILEHAANLDDLNVGDESRKDATARAHEWSLDEDGRERSATSYDEILPNLYIGNWESSKTFDGEILNVRDDRSHLRETYHVSTLIPVPSGHAAPYCVSRARLDECASIISERLLAGKKLLVHCLIGMERSVLAVAWWMVKVGQSPDLDAAIAFIQTKRPIAKNRKDWIEPEIAIAFTSPDHPEIAIAGGAA